MRGQGGSTLVAPFGLPQTIAIDFRTTVNARAYLLCLAGTIVNSQFFIATNKLIK